MSRRHTGDLFGQVREVREGVQPPGGPLEALLRLLAEEENGGCWISRSEVLIINVATYLHSVCSCPPLGAQDMAYHGVFVVFCDFGGVATARKKKFFSFNSI